MASIKEPITTDTRISFINQFGQLVVYDLPVSCPLCHSCLLNRQSGICLYGGPFQGFVDAYTPDRPKQTDDSW